ncbi:DUF99 family protein [Candidatus Bathyarchaeota archaeon]|nr:DUF99 family protein [Candidatus Bathyarchaeota archaeon]
MSLIGVVFRGGVSLDGAMWTDVDVDGRDSTDRIAQMVKSSHHHRQLRVIMLDSVTVAGFNIVDLGRLCDEIHLPVMSVNREKPSEARVKKALANLSDGEEKWRTIENAGKLVEMRVGRTKLYSHVVGMSRENAADIIRISSTRANYPEPLRVAHILAHGLCGGITNTIKS